MMDVDTFLRELIFIFPTKRDLENSELTKLLAAYAEDILYAINKWDGYTCNFQLLLQEIRTHYRYKGLPSIASVIEYLPKAMTPVPVSYSGNEGKVIKRECNGIVYEFTVVPNHWNNVKTVRQLDNAIKERKIND